MRTPSTRSPVQFLTVGLTAAGLGFLPAAAPARPAAPPIELTRFFDAMPKPASLPDGTLATYFVAHRGPGLPPTPAQQEVYARFSGNNGRSWSEPVRQFRLPANQAFGFFVVQVDRDGEVHLLLLADAGTGVLRARTPTADRPAIEPLERSRLDVWHARTHDNRRRWSEPRPIWTGRAGDLQSITQLASGRLLLPLSFFVPRSWRHRAEGPGEFTHLGVFDTTALFTDDGGATWQTSPSILRTPTPTLTGTYGAIEPVVIQLRDNLVWMLIRTQLGQFYQSFSRDGAEWSRPEPAPFFSSDSPAALVRVPDGRIVLLWNNSLRHPYAQGGRRVLHGAVSRDDGGTWTGFREVLRDPQRNEPPPRGGDHGLSYPFPTARPDGSVVFSLWVETGQGRGLYRLDPDWLQETTQSDNFAMGLDGWSHYGTRGVSVIEDASASNGRALLLQAASDGWETGAVWNFPMGEQGTLRLRARTGSIAGRFLLMLTDHFSTPFDLQDRFHSLYNLELGGDGVHLAADRWNELELRWDNAAGVCQVEMEGQAIGTLPLLRRSSGACYLRLRAIGPGQSGALLVDAVTVEITPPGDADPSGGILSARSP
jgi:hypothetical protein